MVSISNGFCVTVGKKFELIAKKGKHLNAKKEIKTLMYEVRPK